VSNVYIAGTSIPSEYSDNVYWALTDHTVESVAVAGSTSSDLYEQIESLGPGSGWILTDGGVENSLAFGFGVEKTASDVITAIDLGHSLGYKVALTDSYETTAVDDSLMQECNETLASVSGADVIIQISDVVNGSDFRRDGVHLTEEGQDAVAQRIADSLTPYLNGDHATSYSGGVVSSLQAPTSNGSLFGGISNDAINALFAQTAFAMSVGGVGVGDFVALLGGGQASYLAAT